VLNNVKDYLDTECIVIFDELVNYEAWDGPNGEWRAFNEFLEETKIRYEYIGVWEQHQSVAVRFFTT
jgi:hypothetical protein